MESFDLVKMHKVVDHPELVVVVHSRIQGLHSFGSGSALGHCTFDLEFGLHEFVVLRLDGSDNVWSMDVLLVGGPVYWL